MKEQNRDGTDEKDEIPQSLKIASEDVEAIGKVELAANVIARFKLM